MQLLAAALIFYGAYLSLVEGGGPFGGLAGPGGIVAGFLLLAGGRAAAGAAVALAAGFHADFTSLSAYDGIVLPLLCVTAVLYVIYQLWRAGMIRGGGVGGDGGDGGFDGGGDGGGG